MPMRIECRNYESRSYGNGDVVRKCNLDLAPEAPWRCPAACAGFAPRSDIAWAWGSAVGEKTPAEPVGEGIAELLDAAEDIVNAAGPDILRELQEERRKATKGWRGKLKRRR